MSYILWLLKPWIQLGLNLLGACNDVAAVNLIEPFIAKSASDLDNSNIGFDSNNKEDVGSDQIGSLGNTNPGLIAGNLGETSQRDSMIKIVKVSSLTNEEKVTGADVALPIAAIDEICDQFANTVYGYFIGSKLAFPIVEKYVCNAWAKYGFVRVIFRNGFFLFKFSSHEGMEKDTVVVAIPFPNGSGHSLENLDVEYEWKPYQCSKCNVFNHDDKFCPSRDIRATPCSLSGNGGKSNDGSGGTVSCNRMHGNKQHAKAKQFQGLKFSKPKSKVIYRRVTKGVPEEAKDTTLTKEESNSADVHTSLPIEASMDAPPSDKGTQKFIQDDIDLGELRQNMDKLMEEDKVLDINTDFGVADGMGTKVSIENNEGSTSNQSVHEEINSNGKGSLWECFQEVKKASASNPKSAMADIGEEYDDDEVLSLEYNMSNYRSSTGRGFTMEDDDLDCYDGYGAQIYDLPMKAQNFCDQFDSRLRGRNRK
ncbi:hypothetical protein Tco_1196830 [Tanacetum coccineum]